MIKASQQETIKTRLDHAVDMVKKEYQYARQLHEPVRSAHEGFGLIYEEVHELLDAIRLNNRFNQIEEAVQVAAMALAYIAEVYPDHELNLDRPIL